MKHLGNYLLCAGYGSSFLLDDGLRVNVITRFVGDGVDCHVHMEAERDLLDSEIADLYWLDIKIDHLKGPYIGYIELPERINQYGPPATDACGENLYNKRYP